MVHPAAFDAYCAGGDSELYLRLSDGAADESSGWVYQAIADSGVVPGAIGIYWSLMLAVTAVRESFAFVCGINFLAPILGAIRAAVDAVVASPPFKLVLCVLYAFGPEDIKASSPGNIALREELAKDGSSAEAVETTIIVMRGMCIGWGVVEIALSLFGATLLMKVCRYFIPVEY